jgi:hypothetical protein
MAISLVEITPKAVLTEGGILFFVEGDFSGKLGVPFRVYVGPNGDDTDTPCYSGVRGQGTVVYPLTEERMRCYLPVLPVTNGSPHDVYVENVDTPSENDVLAGALDVLPAQYYTKVFGLRGVLPRNYAVGPRNMGLLERLP